MLRYPLNPSRAFLCRLWSAGGMQTWWTREGCTVSGCTHLPLATEMGGPNASWEPVQLCSLPSRLHPPAPTRTRPHTPFAAEMWRRQLEAGTAASSSAAASRPASMASLSQLPGAAD